MKKCLALLAVALLPALSLRAQTPTATPSAPSEVERPSQDHIMLQFTYENWRHSSDSISITGIGRGFNGYLCYDFPFQKSHFSFAAGIGVGTSNIYFKDQELVLTDTGSSAAYFRPETKDYKRFKLTTAYAEAPFELRYSGNMVNRNKGFKAAIGFRAGTLIGAHTKGRTSADGTKVNEKLDTRRFLENWRFAGTVRIGWGNFTLFGSYNLNTLFKEGQGPDVTPYSAGLCISGL